MVSPSIAPRSEAPFFYFAKMRRAALLVALLLAACAAPAPSTQSVSLYATSAASPWLSDVYACAGELSLVVQMETASPQIYLRLGEPFGAYRFAYPIAEEEIIAAANQAVQAESLSKEETRALFTRGNSSLQLWVFSAGEEIQLAFGRLVLDGAPVVSTARVASTLREMSAALETQPNAAGVLPKRALTSKMRELYSAGKVPVLALTQTEPQGAARDLILCLQR